MGLIDYSVDKIVDTIIGDYLKQALGDPDKYECGKLDDYKYKHMDGLDPYLNIREIVKKISDKDFNKKA